MDKLRQLVVVGVILATCLKAASGQSISVSTTAAVPKIHVVIVGVPQWDYEGLETSALGGYITKACNDIVALFQERFAPEQIEFHPSINDLCTKPTTTYSAIRRLLYVDLPSFGRNTLTFVFLISHGKVQPYDNQFLHEDLLFLTSNTTKSTLPENALSVGLEFVNWLQKMPAGSTVLTFIDTCNAGAVDTLKLELEKGVQEWMGLRVGMIVGSMANEKTYSANFTEALIKLWRSDSCPNEKLENWIYEQVKPYVLDATGYEGYPKIVIPYAGKWCLNELRAEGKLLFLYQGSAKNIVWKITRSESGRDFTEREIRTGSEPFHFEIVPSGHYSLKATTSAGSKDFGPIDLTTSSSAPVFFEPPKTVEKAYSAVKAYRDAAVFKGVSETETVALNKAVDFAKIAMTSGEQVNVAQSKADFARLRELRARDGKSPDELLKFANDALTSGDLPAAARAFAELAKATADPETRQQVAETAYVVAGASGDLQLAGELRQKVPKAAITDDLAGVVSEEVRANQLNDDVTAKERFRAASTVQVLTGGHGELIDATPKSH